MQRIARLIETSAVAFLAALVLLLVAVVGAVLALLWLAGFFGGAV